MNTFNKHEPVTMGNWMLTMIVLAIPLVNLIMLFYWAFSSGTNPSKRTYCQATLMFGLLALGIVAVAVILQQVAK
ncbi:MAG: hypothetical protein NTV93_20740 [Verrucomicrobia bacterium]|nr:hypothetical protein [Verrucomicrobiota bacterium]